METIKTVLRAIHAALTRDHEAASVEKYLAAAPDLGEFERRMNAISHSDKALLLGAPGR